MLNRILSYFNAFEVIYPRLNSYIVAVEGIHPISICLREQTFLIWLETIFLTLKLFSKIVIVIAAFIIHKAGPWFELMLKRLTSKVQSTKIAHYWSHIGCKHNPMSASLEAQNSATHKRIWWCHPKYRWISIEMVELFRIQIWACDAKFIWFYCFSPVESSFKHFILSGVYSWVMRRGYDWYF